MKLVPSLSFAVVAVAICSPLGFTDAWAPNQIVSSFSSSTTTLKQRYHGSRFIQPTPLRATIEEPRTSDSSSSSSSFEENPIEEPKRRILGQPVPYSELTLGVLTETFPGENRVSQTPDSIRTLVKGGMTVIVQQGGKFFLNFVFILSDR